MVFSHERMIDHRDRVGHGRSPLRDVLVGRTHDHCPQLAAEAVGQSATGPQNALGGAIESGRGLKTTDDVLHGDARFRIASTRKYQMERMTSATRRANSSILASIVSPPMNSHWVSLRGMLSSATS